jgi:hypothetical protein
VTDGASEQPHRSWNRRGIVLAPTVRMPGPQLHELFLLNIALQLFDGVATWQGLPRWQEGNPFIRAAIETAGAGPALMLYKAQACACLLLLRRSAAPALAAWMLAAGAGLYIGLSFVPWMMRFVSLVGA